MKNLLLIIFGILALVFAQSCNKDKGPFLTETTNSINEIDTISYTLHIQPIFDANCISCHNASHSKLNLQQAVSYNQLLINGFSAPYVNIPIPEQSNLYLHLTGGLSLMPPSSAISLNDQELILLWIDQGALNN